MDKICISNLVPANEYLAQTKIAEKEFGVGGYVPYGAYLAMKTANNNVVPWNPSQTCLLASDWTLVEDGRIPNVKMAGSICSVTGCRLCSNHNISPMPDTNSLQSRGCENRG